MRIGFGNDVHRLEKGAPLIVGGIEIDSDVRAVGHSDADVLLHAVTDAILGALALGDIGSHFPPSEEKWKDAASSRFLSNAVTQMHDAGYEVGNVDVVVSLENPKLSPVKTRIEENLARLLKTDLSNVNLKAKTGEGLDAIGKRLAIKAEACILLKKTAS